MKKLTVCLLLIAMSASLLAGCCSSHQWESATCDAPATCKKCGETDGEPLSHIQGDWVVVSEATYTEVGVEKAFCNLCGTAVEVREFVKPILEDGLFTVSYTDALTRWEHTVNQYSTDVFTTETGGYIASKLDGIFVFIKFLEDGKAVSSKVSSPMNADTLLVIFADGIFFEKGLKAAIEFCCPDIDDATLDIAASTINNRKNFEHNGLTFMPATMTEGDNVYDCLYISAE